jgi:signal transduction histidine kinase
VKNLLERTEEMYRKLKISDEYKKNFMSLIGHELRTPLTVIEGYLSLFADGTMKSGDEHGKAALATSMDEARNLESTIENIIELSQLDEGIREVALEEFDVRSLLKDAVTNLEDEIEKTGTRITIDIEENISTFTSDRMKVHQIINQLLSNAIKFSGSNGNVLLSASDGTEGLILAVGDEGIGIPPEQLQNIFDRFYQVDISSTRSYEGSGLGLAIVKEITDVLGGKVWVESVEGSGSTFFVELPGLEG